MAGADARFRAQRAQALERRGHFHFAAAREISAAPAAAKERIPRKKLPFIR